MRTSEEELNQIDERQKAIIKQIQENLETALRNLHNAIRSSGIASTQAFNNAMTRLDEYAFWMSQCSIKLPESNEGDTGLPEVVEGETINETVADEGVSE